MHSSAIFHILYPFGTLVPVTVSSHCRANRESGGDHYHQPPILGVDDDVPERAVVQGDAGPADRPGAHRGDRNRVLSVSADVGEEEKKGGEGMLPPPPPTRLPDNSGGSASPSGPAPTSWRTAPPRWGASVAYLLLDRCRFQGFLHGTTPDPFQVSSRHLLYRPPVTRRPGLDKQI